DRWLLAVHPGFPTGSRCASLAASATGISASSGGSLQWSLDAGPAFAGQVYVLIGSLSGSAPGFDLGGVHVPIELDAYTALLLTAPNSTGAFSFINVGQLDAAGSAVTTLRLPVLPSVVVGLT